MAEPTNKPYPSLEVVSGELTDRKLETEAAEVSKALYELGVSEVRAEGPCGVSRLPVAAIADAWRGRFRDEPNEPWAGGFGTPDFTIFADELDAEFEFCHHNELHVRVEDERLLQLFWARWRALGYAVRQRGEQWEPNRQTA